VWSGGERVLVDGVGSVREALEQLRERGERPELVAAVEAGDYERAFELLLGELDQAVDGQRDEIRRLMVALFAELGPEHPLTVRYRRRLATALY
jgi:hypothetical protein